MQPEACERDCRRLLPHNNNPARNGTHWPTVGRKSACRCNLYLPLSAGAIAAPISPPHAEALGGDGGRLRDDEVPRTFIGFEV